MDSDQDSRLTIKGNDDLHVESSMKTEFVTVFKETKSLAKKNAPKITPSNVNNSSTEYLAVIDLDAPVVRLQCVPCSAIVR